MRPLRAALLAVLAFVVGDDWRTAVGVVLAFGITALTAALGASAWWVMPVAVLFLLWLSVARAGGTGASRRRGRVRAAASRASRR